MDQQPQDPPAARAQARARGLRQVRRWSNGTAAALIAATVVTTGYFARASHSAAGAASAAGTGSAAGVTGGGPGTAASTHQPCVSVPVATSGGSGVTSQTVIRSCGPGTSTSVPVVITTGRTHEGGDS
jgi:hypothetical protein